MHHTRFGSLRFRSQDDNIFDFERTLNEENDKIAIDLHDLIIIVIIISMEKLNYDCLHSTFV